jgi:hypothetical protein
LDSGFEPELDELDDDPFDELSDDFEDEEEDDEPEELDDSLLVSDAVLFDFFEPFELRESVL